MKAKQQLLKIVLSRAAILVVRLLSSFVRVKRGEVLVHSAFLRRAVCGNDLSIAETEIFSFEYFHV